jgi:hypothetical protein
LGLVNDQLSGRQHCPLYLPGYSAVAKCDCSMA